MSQAEMYSSNSELGRALNSVCSANGIVGASVALYEHGSHKSATYGLVNNRTAVEATDDAIFRIGSIAKLLTATLVMQLVDQDLLDLDRPVQYYLPEFAGPAGETAGKITVRMLINHTNGIDGEGLPSGGPDKERVVDAFREICTLGSVHPPGSLVSYSNAGLVVAGYLCERVQQKSWYQLVEERIFAPLEMSSAIVDPGNVVLYRASSGHVVDPQTGIAQPFRHPFSKASYAPAGSTAMMHARDLIVFAQAHLNDGVGPNGARILSERSAKAMKRPTVSFSDVHVASLGLGWMVSGAGILMHAGGGEGSISHLWADPKTNSALAILVNTVPSGTAAIRALSEPFLTARGDRPFGHELGVAISTATDTPVDGARYVGVYENIVSRAEVVQEDDRLFGVSFQRGAATGAATSKPAKFQLRPVGGHVFAVFPEGASTGVGALRFVNPDHNGKMRHLAQSLRLLKRVA